MQSQASTFECGRQPINRRGYSSRFYGGYYASPGELPWMARIEIRNRNEPIEKIRFQPERNRDQRTNLKSISISGNNFATVTFFETSAVLQR